MCACTFQRLSRVACLLRARYGADAHVCTLMAYSRLALKTTWHTGTLEHVWMGRQTLSLLAHGLKLERNRAVCKQALSSWLGVALQASWSHTEEQSSVGSWDSGDRPFSDVLALRLRASRFRSSALVPSFPRLMEDSTRLKGGCERV